jgi:hypothetical protein
VKIREAKHFIVTYEKDINSGKITDTDTIRKLKIAREINAKYWKKVFDKIP